MTKEEYNFLSGQILDASIEVHKQLGPGLLESAYQYALIVEFQLRNIKAVSKVAIPLYYNNFDTGKVYEIDILIENEIILELKAVDFIHAVYEAQLISYLKLADKRLGFLINFHVPLMKDGFKRFVNNF